MTDRKLFPSILFVAAIALGTSACSSGEQAPSEQTVSTTENNIDKAANNFQTVEFNEASKIRDAVGAETIAVHSDGLLQLASSDTTTNLELEDPLSVDVYGNFVHNPATGELFDFNGNTVCEYQTEGTSTIESVSRRGESVVITIEDRQAEPNTTETTFEIPRIEYSCETEERVAVETTRTVKLEGDIQTTTFSQNDKTFQVSNTVGSEFASLLDANGTTILEDYLAMFGFELSDDGEVVVFSSYFEPNPNEVPISISAVDSRTGQFLWTINKPAVGKIVEDKVIVSVQNTEASNSNSDDREIAETLIVGLKDGRSEQIDFSGTVLYAS